jgi:hypothetical protein
MAKYTIPVVAVAAVFLALTACSDTPNVAGTPEAKTEPAPPPEPVTGKTAFYKMYKPVREWAPDLLVLSLVPDELPEMKNVDGKSAKWVAVFASPSKHQARTAYYSVIDSGPNTQKGVTVAPSETWSGPSGPNRPFPNNTFAIDSDAAYKTALAKGKAWIDKHPDKSVSMLLSQPTRFGNPVWYFIWGDRKNGFDVLVNATTGELQAGK